MIDVKRRVSRKLDDQDAYLSQRQTIVEDEAQLLKPPPSVKLSAASCQTDAEIRKSWSGGRFFVMPKLPFKSEEPKHVRELAVLPRSKEAAAAVLKRHRIAAINLKGRKSDDDKTIGQDMFSCCYLGSGWWLDLVADGHGVVGDTVADRICRVLPHYMNSTECSSLLKAGKIVQCFEEAFEQAQKDIVDVLAPVHGNKLMFSGSTCVCLLRQENSSVLHVAWVGDSKAILLRPDGTVTHRTAEHKPENVTERQRVEASGCEVVSYTHEDGVTLQKINVRGQSYPAISFTRSFGDQCVKDKGVHAIPQVEKWLTAPTANKGMFAALKDSGKHEEGSDGYVLLASDGVWEFLTDEEVGAFIGDRMKRGKTPEEILAELVSLSQEKWVENEGDYCDDITCVLVSVKTSEPQPPVPDTSCECFDGCSLM